MSGTSWTQKQINITITLGTGTFGSTGQNTVKLSNLRVVATIEKGGFPSQDRASIRVYGVPASIANQVSTLGIPQPMIRLGNTVTLEAGDTVNGMSVVYSGYMLECFQNFEEIPETSLQINAYFGMIGAMKPATPLSIRGTGDVATMMSGLANLLDCKFENNGVQVQLSNPYFPGTALAQAHELARAANINLYLDLAGGTLAIWPLNGTRGGQIPLINPASGMIGYPTFQSNGMSFKTLFNPNIRLGGQIQMQSSVGNAATAANNPNVPAGTQTGGPSGLWLVQPPLVHSLSAQLPGGPWFTDVHCVRVPGTPASR